MGTTEILTIKEVAELLRIGEKTAYTMAKDGKLPGFKVGGQWRFRRADIDAWIQARLASDSPRGNPDDGGRSLDTTADTPATRKGT